MTISATSKGIAPAPIVIPRDWRWAVASWPHERWVRWREQATAMLEDLDDEPTAEDIRAADCAAYDLIRTDGGLTR